MALQLGQSLPQGLKTGDILVVIRAFPILSIHGTSTDHTR